MAVLKHLASKNSNYGNSADYLIYKYDEHINKPVLDRYGHIQMRDEHLIEGINCEPETFDAECYMLNSEYGKNQSRGEIKSHHYIISFDPEDTADGLLTAEKAQKLGMAFARKFFPGHQCLVATHTDGNNGSGNIHVHIVLNSLRKFDTEHQPWERSKGDHMAGRKHNCSKEFMETAKAGVMYMCRKENLHQVDLLSPPEVRVTDREYRAKQRGQKELDQKNADLISAGKAPKQTKFQTQKDELRAHIEDSLMYATSVDQFRTNLADRYGIELFDKKGRLSYLIPGRQKNISERALGTKYGREYIYAAIEKNAQRAEQEAQKQVSDQIAGAMPEIGPDSIFYTGPDESEAASEPAEEPSADHHSWHKYDPQYDYKADPTAAAWIQSNLRPVVDIEHGPIAEKCRAYKEKVEVSNLQKMVDTVVYCEQTELVSYDELDRRLADTNEQIKYLSMYSKNRDTYKQFCDSENKGAFRKEHEKEISEYETARKWLNQRFPRSADGKSTWPKMKELNQQKRNLETVKTNLGNLRTWDQPEQAIPEKKHSAQKKSAPKKPSVQRQVKKNEREIADREPSIFHIEPPERSR